MKDYHVSLIYHEQYSVKRYRPIEKIIVHRKQFRYLNQTKPGEFTIISAILQISHNFLAPSLAELDYSCMLLILLVCTASSADLRRIYDIANRTDVGDQADGASKVAFSTFDGAEDGELITVGFVKISNICTAPFYRVSKIGSYMFTQLE